MKRVFSFSRTTILSAAASLAVAITITAPADAAPIRFDNPAGPGHFEWEASAGQVGLDAVFLDILKPAGEQGAASFGQVSAFGQENFSDLASRVLAGGSNVDVSSIYAVQFDPNIPAVGTFPFGANSLFPPSSSPIPGHAGGYVVNPLTFHPSLGSHFNTDQVGYLPVRFDLGVGLQHGWIEVMFDGFQFDALAWGYETEPGVPIAAGVPEPGMLSLLALGGAALLRRRRQRAGK